ncbi:MAG: lysostaphin resistance A-like protein [Salibacteraceae bacterium]
MGNRLLTLFGLCAAGMFISSLIGYGLAVWLFDIELSQLADHENYRSLQGMKLSQALITIGTFLVPALILARVYKQKISEFFLTKSIRFDLLVITTLLAFAAIPVIAWMAELNSQMIFPESLSWLEEIIRSAEDNAMVLTEALLNVTTYPELAINVVVIAVLPALGEEFLFRGALQQTLIKSGKNRHAAIWITAIIFSAIHFQFYGFLPRMVLGALFGYLMVWGGSIWYSVWAHFINNATSVYIMFLINRKEVEGDLETFGANSGDWFYAILGVVVVLASLGFFRFITLQKQAE